jgi:2-amino-4-hydroxy-6-hydroxymethyldihydropteridine diphosphokinase
VAARLEPLPGRAYVGLGSNLDDPAARVREALARLDALPGVAVARHSALYLTPPWGLLEQPAFVNAVAELHVALAPEALLDGLLGIERAMGRERGERWGPRRIDLDLLHVEGQARATPRLQLPHPRLAERAFVLRPLADLAEDLHIPGAGRVGDLLAGVDHAGIQRVP